MPTATPQRGRHRRGPPALAALLAIAGLALALAPAPAAAQPAGGADEEPSTTDYDDTSRDWNGLSTFAGIIAGFGLTLEVRTTLDYAELGAGDILMVVYPLQRLEPGPLASFVRSGGQLLLADDFGDSSDALARLGMLRSDGAGVRASRYQDDRPFAPVAEPFTGRHPLSEEVDELVTNHPAVLHGIKGADPVIGFADGNAVVVASSSGPGRVVVLSDPSVLINRMLEFEGNLQLAINIVRFLQRDGETPTRRVVLLHGSFVLTGEPQSMLDDGSVKNTVSTLVGDMNRWLDEKNDYLLTPDGLQWIAILAAMLVGLIGVLALHVRRGPELDGAWTRGPSGTGVIAGPTDFDQLVARYDGADASSNLILPAAILRDGVQAALGALVERPDPLYSMAESDLIAAVEAQRGRAAGSALRALYRRLKLLPGRAQAASPWSTGQLGRREFERLHDDVRELYRTLGEEREPDGR